MTAPFLRDFAGKAATISPSTCDQSRSLLRIRNISADKALREVVGHDGAAHFKVPNGKSRSGVAREMEVKLILGFRGWDLSENYVAEKNPNGLGN